MAKKSSDTSLDELQQKVDSDLKDGKKRKDIMASYGEKYGKAEVGKAINQSPVSQFNYLKSGSGIMTILTVLSSLLPLLNDGGTAEFLFTLIVQVVFAIPYVIAWAIMQFSSDLQYQKIAAYGMVIYHILFVLCNLVFGAMAGTLGVGILIIVFTVYFIIALRKWPEYEALMKKK